MQYFRSLLNGLSNNYIQNCEDKLLAWYNKLDKTKDKQMNIWALVIELICDDFDVRKVSFSHQHFRANGFKFRRRAEPEAFCTADTQFRCQMPDCLLDHLINPFTTEVQKKSFRNYELDHLVEQAKVPAFIIQNAERVYDSGSKLVFNSEYLFGLICSRSNLRMVHSICHGNKIHSFVVNPAKAIIDNVDSLTPMAKLALV